MRGLLKGELWLTVDILLGLALGYGLLRWGLADRLMRRAMPWLRRHGIDPVTGLALTVSLGSSKAGAAILASALEEGRIDRRHALWGTLMLPFPAYLRRWPATCALAVGLAGWPGGIFALFLLARSAARFLLAFFILRRGRAARPAEGGRFRHERPPSASPTPPLKLPGAGLGGKLVKTLPLAWLFFALAYALVPWADHFLKRQFLGGTFLPLAGWAVAAGSLAHVSAALSLAGGSLAAGELSPAQAAFALILGSALGVASRILRQNAGYYFGLFPADLARKMLFWNLGTLLPIVAVSVLAAAVPLLF